jgi:hypothetical protein
MAQEAFMEKFRACYLGDDLDTFMELMDEGAVWTFMGVRPLERPRWRGISGADVAFS